MAKSMDDHLLQKIEEVEKVHWWWEGRRQLVKMLLGNKSYKKILDVGCGTGETLTYLGGLYPKAELAGVDTSAKAIEFAKNRGLKAIFKASATKLPFKSSTFDVVLLLDVLEHIKDDVLAIMEAKRVLKKNGLIIITAPALQFIWSNYDTNQGHQRRYTRRRFTLIANNLNIKVSFLSYFNFLFCPPIILIRVLSNLKRFNELSSYDNEINLNIANNRLLNSLLKTLFMTEIALIKFVKPPIGISVAAVLKKK